MGKVQREVFRKSIHIVGFVVPFLAITLGMEVAAIFIVSVSVLYCLSEYLRLKGRSFPVLSTITNLAMRSDSDKEAENRFVKAPLYFAVEFWRRF